LIDPVTTQNLSTADFRDGACVLVDKPEGWTSFDVVNKIRATLRHVYQVKKIKVGHAGTLDPMATGLLLICTGKCTKQLSELQGLDKEYAGEMMFGAVTASYDRETEPENPKSCEHITVDEIHSAAAGFIGQIEQIPPMYSAIKKDGQPLYKAARRGEEVVREGRKVAVHSFEITHVDLPKVAFRVSCSKGTYIRSLAHDLGQLLSCGAYLTALRRTRIGDYKIEHAWDLELLIAAIREQFGQPY